MAKEPFAQMDGNHIVTTLNKAAAEKDPQKRVPLILDQQCIYSAHLNRRYVYPELELQLIIGSLGLGVGKPDLAWWEYGKQEVKEISDLITPTGKLDTHAWLEDQKGLIYEGITTTVVQIAKIRGKCVRVQTGHVFYAVSKEEAAKKGFHYRAAPKPVQQQVWNHWVKKSALPFVIHPDGPNSPMESKDKRPCEACFFSFLGALAIPPCKKLCKPSKSSKKERRQQEMRQLLEETKHFDILVSDGLGDPFACLGPNVGVIMVSSPKQGEKLLSQLAEPKWKIRLREYPLLQKILIPKESSAPSLKDVDVATLRRHCSICQTTELDWATVLASLPSPQTEEDPDTRKLRDHVQQQKTVKLSRCGKCNSSKVLYCSAACQRQDWKAGHKNACQAPKDSSSSS